MIFQLKILFYLSNWVDRRVTVAVKPLQGRFCASDFWLVLSRELCIFTGLRRSTRCLRDSVKRLSSYSRWQFWLKNSIRGYFWDLDPESKLWLVSTHKSCVGLVPRAASINILFARIGLRLPNYLLFCLCWKSLLRTPKLGFLVDHSHTDGAQLIELKKAHPCIRPRRLM